MDDPASDTAAGSTAGPAVRTPARLVVLVSGSGSNLQAVLDACAADHLPAQVVAVVSNRADAGGLERARRAGVPAHHLAPQDFPDRPAYDARLAELVAEHDPDLVVLAGWMRLLTMAFLEPHGGRVINLHPARPSDLPGTRAIERAWEQAARGERTTTGVMVHLVPDEGVDDGPVLATVEVPIDVAGGFERFAADMHAAEHRLLVDTIHVLCAPIVADGPQPEPTPDPQPNRRHEVTA